MRVTLFAVWTSFWIAISVIAIISAAGIYFVSKDRVEVDDYISGSNLNADYWRGGEFLGFTATRIRRITHSRGFPVHEDRIFYVEVPIAPAELEQKLAQWKSEPTTNFTKRHFADESLSQHRPSWFTLPTPSNYVGELIDSSSWRVTIIQAPGNDRIHLIVY